jgi:hypothetical protein
MSESTLALTYHEIRRLIGERRGYGITVDEWIDDPERASIVEDCVRRGSRMFYSQSGHDWSFLKPIKDLTIPSGVSEIPLPSYFGFLIGKLYFQSASNGRCQPLLVENAGKVLWRRQVEGTTPTTGQPQYAALDSREPGETHGSRKYLVFWPESDQEYTVTGQFSVIADALSTNDPHPWGGAAYAETILQACLAASEQRDNEIGVQTALYKEALAMSIEYDKQVKPQTLTQQMDQPYYRSGYVTYTPTL